MTWPGHICGRSTGWRGWVFTVRHWWRSKTGYYEREHAKMLATVNREAVQRLTDHIDAQALELYKRAWDDKGNHYLVDDGSFLPSTAERSLRKEQKPQAYVVGRKAWDDQEPK